MEERSIYESLRRYEEKNIGLVQDYLNLLDKWLDSEMNDKEAELSMLQIRERLDHIIYGINYGMIIQQNNLQKSGIQIPTTQR